MTRCPLRLIPALALLGLLAAPALASNGPSLAVIGNKGPVDLPVDGDAFSAYRMPSSIAWSLNNQGDIDLFLFFSRSNFQNSQNDYEASGSTIGGSLGLIVPLGRPDFEEEPEAFKSYSYANKWTLHIGEYVEATSGGGKTRVRSTEFPDTIKLGTGILFLTTAVTVAYTPTEWLAIAVQGDFIASTLNVTTLSDATSSGGLAGSPQIAGVPIPGNPTYADFLGLFASDNASDPTTQFESSLFGFQLTGTFAASIRPNDSFGFGIAFSPRSAEIIEFEGKAEVSANRTFASALEGLAPAIQDIFLDTLPNGGQQGFVADYDVKITGIRVPRKVRASVAYWPFPNWLIAGQVSWIEWRRAFNKAKIVLTNGTNQDVNFVVGGNSVNTELELRFSNQWIFALYTAIGVTDSITLRLGASYGETPLNLDTQGNGPTTGFVETTLTAGAGFRLTEYLDLNTLVEYAVYREVESDGSPTSLTAKFSEYGGDQLFLHVGVTLRF